MYQLFTKIILIIYKIIWMFIPIIYECFGIAYTNLFLFVYQILLI